MLRAQDILYGLQVSEIQRICKVDITTARRWKRGAICPPESALMILAGDLGAFDPAWAGWRLVRGELISPEGWRATPGDVLSIQFTQAQLSEWRIEAKRLRAKLEEYEFEEQPLPDSIDPMEIKALK